MHEIKILEGDKSFQALFSIFSVSNALMTHFFTLNNHPTNGNNPIFIPLGSSKNEIFFDPKQLNDSLLGNKPLLEFSFLVQSCSFDYEKLIQEENGFDYSSARKSVIQGSFIQFYEINKPQQSTITWSDNWKFAWVIRNSFAHGGKINWIDVRISNVSWNGINYDRILDNGKNIIFENFGEAEIILLLTSL